MDRFWREADIRETRTSVKCQFRTLFKNDVCDASREHLSLQT